MGAKKQGGAGLVVSVLVLGCVLVLAGGALYWMSRGPMPSQDYSTEVITAAEVGVRREIKAADTAEFENVRITQIDGRKYVVSGDVTAKNSLGVPIRTRWIAAVKREDGDCSVLSVALDE
jgi:hypothetical protein